jgi:diadenosine tetraphosphate (Ap4A) HIT family hydrolase
MPETPEELFARASQALRTPPVHEWETFPFKGRLAPRDLLPPTAGEPRREGEGGVDCHACQSPDARYLWTDAHWRLKSTSEPTGLPLVLLLESRDHIAEPGDLSEDLAAELGVLQASVERAMRAITEVGRVHVCRWGDGAEHLHWWFLARPARLPQLLGSFAAIWDDVLPPTPVSVWQANIDTFLAAFTSPA